MRLRLLDDPSPYGLEWANERSALDTLSRGGCHVRGYAIATSKLSIFAPNRVSRRRGDSAAAIRLGRRTGETELADYARATRGSADRPGREPLLGLGKQPREHCRLDSTARRRSL